MPVGTLEHWKKRFQKKLFFLNGPALSPSPLAIKRRTFFPASLGKVLIKIQLFADISTNGGWGGGGTNLSTTHFWKHFTWTAIFKIVFFFSKIIGFTIFKTLICVQERAYFRTPLYSIYISKEFKLCINVWFWDKKFKITWNPSKDIFLRVRTFCITPPAIRLTMIPASWSPQKNNKKIWPFWFIEVGPTSSHFWSLLSSWTN